MKLIHENGPDKGKDIELRPPFISLGRETDNDVIINEHEVSRYHAKIEKDGTVWVIRDLGSSNGFRINGQKIDESSPLEHRDELRIGSMSFSIIDPTVTPEPAETEAATATPAETEAAAATPADTPMDPIVTGTPKDEATQKRVRLMITALMALIIVFVGLFLLNAPKTKVKQVDQAALKKARFEKAPLRVEYRHEKSGWDEDLNDYNLELYEVTIKDHKISARVEKLLEGVNFTKSEELTPVEESEIKSAILALNDDEFVNALSLPPKERARGFECLTFMAHADTRGNAVEYVNEEGQIPQPVTKAILKVKAIVERKLEIPALSLKEAFASAKEHFDVAKNLNEERRADPKNLWNAIVNANKALVVCKGYKQTPTFYRELQDLHQSCKKEHDDMIEDLEKKAAIDERTDLNQAKSRYQEIINRIGNPQDPRFQAARVKIYKIDRELRKGGRK